MNQYNIVGISGSLRKASTNTGLLRAAQKIATDNPDIGINADIADISEIPFFNADIADKIPAPVQQLLDKVTKADAIILACPEYNYSVAPALKNALDWLSRLEGNKALNGKAAAIIGAGGGMGTSRAQYHLRQTCVYLNLHLLNKPEFFSNAFSDAFDSATGNLISENLKGQLQELLMALHALIEKLK